MTKSKTRAQLATSHLAYSHFLIFSDYSQGGNGRVSFQCVCVRFKIKSQSVDTFWKGSLCFRRKFVWRILNNEIMSWITVYWKVANEFRKLRRPGRCHKDMVSSEWNAVDLWRCREAFLRASAKKEKRKPHMRHERSFSGIHFRSAHSHICVTQLRKKREYHFNCWGAGEQLLGPAQQRP